MNDFSREKIVYPTVIGREFISLTDSEEGGNCVMKPKVTIGICVKNCEATIEGVVDSVLNQDFPHELMEVIFVDDGSQDRTLSVISGFVSKMDMQVKVYHHEWKGLGLTRNVVVNNADGDYIIWVDGDMKLPRYYVRKHGGKTALELPVTEGSIYRVKAIRQVGGFDDQINGAGEDLDAAYRVGAVGWLFGTTSAELYESCRETWKSLWDQYVWYGYGGHYIVHKNKIIIPFSYRL